MTGTTSISVLIPTYNRAAYLPATLNSVLSQTREPVELILVDDGSTDDTADVVQQWRKANPRESKKLLYVHQDNRGKSAALNNALRRAKGEWIAFNDSDDVWVPDKLECQVAALRLHPDCEVCFADTDLNEFDSCRRKSGLPLAGELGRIDQPSHLFANLNMNGIYMVTILATKRAIQNIGGFDERFMVSQDIDFLFRLGLNRSWCYVARPLVLVGRESGRTVGLTTEYPWHSWTRMFTAEAILTKWKYLYSHADPELSAQIEATLASMRSGIANKYLSLGDTRSAREALLDTLRGAPEARTVAKLVATYLPSPLVRLVALRLTQSKHQASQTPPSPTELAIRNHRYDNRSIQHHASRNGVASNRQTIHIETTAAQSRKDSDRLR